MGANCSVIHGNHLRSHVSPGNYSVLLFWCQDAPVWMLGNVQHLKAGSTPGGTVNHISFNCHPPHEGQGILQLIKKIRGRYIKKPGSATCQHGELGVKIQDVWMLHGLFHVNVIRLRTGKCGLPSICSGVGLQGQSYKQVLFMMGIRDIA